MAKRKAISKSVRFEVFKRDSFTCQYCGRSAPDVILEVDHIHPVAEGGDNDITNLITSCRDCNRGKGKKLLSARDEVKKSQEQLKELNEKRQQLEMMLEWRKELSQLSDMEVDVAESEFFERTGIELNSTSRDKLAKFIKTYGLSEVCEAVVIYISSYYDPVTETFSRGLDTIGGICYNRKKQRDDPAVYWLNRIAYIINKEYQETPKWRIKQDFSDKVKTKEECEYIISLFYQSLTHSHRWAYSTLRNHIMEAIDEWEQ